MKRLSQSLLLAVFVGLTCYCGTTQSVHAVQLDAATPAAPTGVVCIQVVCPSPSAQEAPPCPSRCADSCHITSDPCCPKLQVAVCSNSSTTMPPTIVPSPSISQSTFAVTPSSTGISSPTLSSQTPTSTSKGCRTESNAVYALFIMFLLSLAMSM